jgi:putative ABC transport system substrate-binding protein
MKRRNVIALAGGAAAWPLVARAQAQERIYRIGVIMQISKDDPEAKARVNALLQGLNVLGYDLNKNIQLEFRGPADSAENIRERTKELLATNRDIILAVPDSVVREIQRQSQKIPIVFVNVIEPIDAGLIKSLSRPGGNTTGLMSAEQPVAGKWVQLLKSLSPEINNIVVMRNAGNRGNDGQLTAIEKIAALEGVQLSSTPINNPSEIQKVFSKIASETRTALIVLPGGPVTVNRKLILQLARDQRVPAVYGYKYYAQEGGLISYGPDVLDMWNRAASYVDRILKGEKPSDLPVQAPIRYELAINLKTAKEIGLSVPEAFLLGVDEIIE